MGNTDGKGYPSWQVHLLIVLPVWFGAGSVGCTHVGVEFDVVASLYLFGPAIDWSPTFFWQTSANILRQQIHLCRRNWGSRYWFGRVGFDLQEHQTSQILLYIYRWKPQGHLQRFFYIYLCHLCKYSMYRIILLLHTYNVRPLKLIHTVVWQLSKLGFMGKTSTVGQHTCFYI